MQIPRLRFPLCLAALALLAASTSAPATVTLQFSSGTRFATNWADGAGAGGSSLAWGIIVDTNGDGLAANYLTTGVDYGATGPSSNARVGQSLRDGNGELTDDVLFMNLVTMLILSASNEGTDGAHQGQNLITIMSSLPLLPGINPGDPFYLVWFDHAGAPNSTPSGSPQPGENYGILGNAAFTLPNEGATASYASVFAGADPLRQMTRTWVPEPSAALLSALGALGLMRRRR